MIEQNSLQPAVRTSRLKMVIAYDGRPFEGWQSQARGNTVQDRLEAAFSRLCSGQRITVHGSGRTDSGVHARGQVAHADVPGRERHSNESWRSALNAHLPREIRVLRVRAVSRDFHARFSARGKVYRYRIWNAPVLSPFQFGRAWHLPMPLDLTPLREAADRVTGTHDFASFAANRREPVANTVRTIYRLDIKQTGVLLTLEFEGDGFLYKMVRLLTGSLIRCAQGRASSSWIDSLLAGTAKTSFAAPAEGLCLMKVLYARKRENISTARQA